MNQKNQAKIILDSAKRAYHAGKRLEARRLASQAIQIDPQFEDPWLLLAGISSPGARLNYLKRALEINPHNPVTRRALNMRTLPHLSSPHDHAQTTISSTRTIPGSQPKHRLPNPGLSLHSKSRSGLDVALWFMGLLNLGLVSVFAILLTITPVEDTFTFARSISLLQIMSPLQQAIAQAPLSDAQANIPALTATYTPLPPEPNTPTYTTTPTLVPTSTKTPTPTSTATTPPTNTPPPTETYTPEPTDIPPPAAVYIPANVDTGEHWIDVDLSEQMLYAYIGDQIINSFIISSGAPLTSTPLGQYAIYIKYRIKNMRGSDYYYPDVPYQMYFYKDFGIHTAYWHDDFGTPVSHGCINMREEDAGWLFEWSSVGTIINIHN